MTNGKGDKVRKRQVKWSQYSKNWDIIFKKRDKNEKK